MEKFWSKRSHGIVCPSSVHFATYTGTLLTVIKRIQSPPVAHKDSSSSFSLWYHCQPPPSLACVRPFEPSGPWIPMRTPRVLLPPTFSVLGMVWSFLDREREAAVSHHTVERRVVRKEQEQQVPRPLLPKTTHCCKASDISSLDHQSYICSRTHVHHIDHDVYAFLLSHCRCTTTRRRCLGLRVARN